MLRGGTSAKPAPKRASVHSASATPVEEDYAEAGKKLLERVNLGEQGAPERYSPCDPLWRHPESGATMYVGGQRVASDREELRKLNITRIVNCQDRDGRNYFQSDPDLEYLQFEIGTWRSVTTATDGGPGTWKYFEPVFRFVSDNLTAGQNVLVHCLAGAHRAGTCGIALLMLFCRWDSKEATSAAQRLRPAIMPIGGFPILLAALDRAKVGTERRLSTVLPDGTLREEEEEEEDDDDD
eukprot:Hpha_TRINITY_DN16523_c8_g1::TRINITY_DN16523_c8_g1_i1::g.137072::m.137072